MSEHALRRRAREKLDRRELPSTEPQRIWIDSGTGEACSLCGELIGEPDLEYELEYRPGLTAGSALLRFHSRCHAAWQTERLRADESA
jgi:hypothetical protein